MTEQRNHFLKKYLFDWEILEIILTSKSAIDSKRFTAVFNSLDQAEDYLSGYGYQVDNPVVKAEMYGYYQESLQFIRQNFLYPDYPLGFKFEIPQDLVALKDPAELLLFASRPKVKKEVKIWSSIILKLMHTLIHADKDLRSNYFAIIQQQIFDRFYRFLHRDQQNQLFLGKTSTAPEVYLQEFQTKAKKSRQSMVIKMLHKSENVAEELFDRVGIRFITKQRTDALLVTKFLFENNIILPQNVKPSRSVNLLVDIGHVRTGHYQLLKKAIKEKWSEQQFQEAFEKLILQKKPQFSSPNQHSKSSYRAMQFTCRQLIQYKNPLVAQLLQLKREAKEASGQHNIVDKVKDLDLSLIARDIRFFYPYEIQIMDFESYLINTEGEASHQEYKEKQKRAAANRLFQGLLEFKQMKILE